MFMCEQEEKDKEEKKEKDDRSFIGHENIK